ncbi:hypothetical protein HYH03_017572 [Edaphochlamys debaryana]|uniref:Uncharacterized protein n=1 Tax=Edaphochlamys debaryana TaxID=47281 RepID=A0A836BP06_9CHLO|nr:hypothetical protein HYH03_017572 [Edaphochlamys debaryana]|eukprot:KAG2483565.1 hypothetical protein HYH03_017572 [Edaphochlamys debaryana]
MRSVGTFEGLLEAFSYAARMCNGVVSDRMTSRKAAITLGFAAGAMAKFGTVAYMIKEREGPSEDARE